MTLTDTDKNILALALKTLGDGEPQRLEGTSSEVWKIRNGFYKTRKRVRKEGKLPELERVTVTNPQIIKAAGAAHLEVWWIEFRAKIPIDTLLTAALGDFTSPKLEELAKEELQPAAAPFDFDKLLSGTMLDANLQKKTGPD